MHKIMAIAEWTTGAVVETTWHNTIYATIYRRRWKRTTTRSRDVSVGHQSYAVAKARAEAVAAYTNVEDVSYFWEAGNLWTVSWVVVTKKDELVGTSLA